MADVVLTDLLAPVVDRVLPDLPGPQADGLAAALLLDRRRRRWIPGSSAWRP